MPARRRDGAGREAAEACARELREETGLQGHVTRLIGIYTNPHLRVECTDGDRIQPVACSFEVAVTGGELTLSDETTATGWFTPDESAAVDVLDHHRERIIDAFAAREAAFVKCGAPSRRAISRDAAADVQQPEAEQSTAQEVTNRRVERVYRRHRTPPP